MDQSHLVDQKALVTKWKFWGGGGDLREIPSVVGVWILSATTQYAQFYLPHSMGTTICTEIPHVSHLANDRYDLSLGCVTVIRQLPFLNH